MTISIQIHIPDSEIGDGLSALERRLAVLGYGFGLKAVQVIGEQTNYDPMADIAREDDLTQQARIDASHAKTEAPKRGRPKKAEAAAPAPEPAKVEQEPQPNISTEPENRVDPEAEAQDAEDEAAEVTAAPAKTMTAEDLRAVMGRYVNAHGLEAAQADGPAIFVDALGAAPAGFDLWTVTLASQNPETLAKAVAAWEAAASAGSRYGRS
jgi:hypothetical protein